MALLRASYDGDARTVAALLAGERLGVDVNQADNDGVTPLLMASQNGHAEVVSMLLATQGIDVNKAWERNIGREQITPLRAAIDRSHTEIAKLLVIHGSILVDEPTGAHGIQLGSVLGAFAQAYMADYDALCAFRLCLVRTYNDKPSKVEGAPSPAQRRRMAAHMMSRRGTFALPRIESFLLPCHPVTFKPDRTVRHTLTIILNLTAAMHDHGSTTES